MVKTTTVTVIELLLIAAVVFLGKMAGTEAGASKALVKATKKINNR